ncbi:LOW QUALITY PROTEIN: heat shock transcription factor, Y-linked-like [Pezoporus occidentalis]|uniref:LOW QUALITY PROTEIN: heat shock transcription factor, Y-linked-like n=1 Tax=Pezoporus occidentalis TaxID=407982 RepID=UPI002F9082C9
MTFKFCLINPGSPSCNLVYQISAKTNPSSARSFLMKLWKTVGSHHFKSVSWADDGNCIVIAENLFRKEVLGRSGPRKIFETKSMRGFILQLNLHGFCKMEGDSLITTSIEELQELAEAGSGLEFSKQNFRRAEIMRKEILLFFYYNPFFKRDYPNLLKMFTESAGKRERAPVASSLGPRMRGNCK